MHQSIQKQCTIIFRLTNESNRSTDPPKSLGAKKQTNATNFESRYYLSHCALEFSKRQTKNEFDCKQFNATVNLDAPDDVIVDANDFQITKNFSNETKFGSSVAAKRQLNSIIS